MGPCPVCGTHLKRSEFFEQTFEDVAVEREVRIRKQMLKMYEARWEAGGRAAGRHASLCWAIAARLAPRQLQQARGGL